MSPKTRLKGLKTRLLELIDRMSVSEKIILGILSALMVANALILLKHASNALAIEVPIQGGVLREGVVGYPRSINPLLPVTDSGRDLSNLIYSGLMKVGENGTLIPDLAKDYKVSDDGLTYTFTLKDKLYFHDGTPLTASDVEFTVKKVTDPIIKSPLGANWDGITVKAENDKTVVFTLKKPYAPFIENTTLGILPMHIWKNVGSDAFLFSEFNIEPVGSGPYKIKEIKRNSAGLPEYYHLVPFSDYALGTPYIANVFAYFYTNEENLIQGFEKGEIDSMSSISPQSALKLDKSKISIEKTPLPRDYAVFFNQNQSKVLADQTIRKALKLATPKEKIIKEVMQGYATVIESPLLGGLSGIKADEESDEQGIEEAKTLLSKNGWSVGSTTNVLTKSSKSGGTQTLTLSLSVPDVPELKATAEIIKDAWQSIGAKVTIKVFDSSDLEQNVIIPRQFDTLLFGEAIGRDVDLYPFWASSERNYPGLNIAGYANAKADKALADARSASDSAKRQKYYQSFENEISNDIPAIFLYSPDLIYVLPKSVHGVKIYGITSSSERFSNISKWYIETEHVWKLPWIKTN